MNVSYSTFALASFLLLGTANAANAHVNFEKRQANADTTYKAVLAITHGCDGSPTHTFRVRIPDGVFNVKPMPKPGWKINVVEGRYSRPQNYHGKTYEKGVTEIIWSGGHVPDRFFDEFVFRARIGTFEKSTMLYFPATQVCEKGQLDWVEVPTSSKGRGSLDRPAPVLQVLPNTAKEHQH